MRAREGRGHSMAAKEESSKLEAGSSPTLQCHQLGERDKLWGTASDAEWLFGVS